MKVTLYISLTFAICCAQDDGRYIPGDEGKYVHDDSGRYVPDYSGLYHHDGRGRYTGDGSGKYRDQIEKYNGRKSIYFNNLEAAGTVLSNNIVKPKATYAGDGDSNFRKSSKSETFDNGKWKIIRQITDNSLKGYHWEFETENKINAEEFGNFDKANTAEEALKTNGYFSYTGPDDITYSIVYTADENGFIPKGDHLPISLQRALAQISSGKN